MGQVFTRELKKSPEDMEAYKELVGNSAKKAWRDKWLASKLENAKKMQMQTTKQTVAQHLTGHYKSFRKIWEEEGLDEAGYKAPMGEGETLTKTLIE